jgi:hypothetical protein
MFGKVILSGDVLSQEGADLALGGSLGPVRRPTPVLLILGDRMT